MNKLNCKDPSVNALVTYETKSREKDHGHACHVNANIDSVMVVCAILFLTKLAVSGQRDFRG